MALPTTPIKPTKLKPADSLKEAAKAVTARELAKMRSSFLSSSKRILLYGNAKVGKTAMAATACISPEITRVIWLDLEQGIDTIFNSVLDVPDSALDKIIPISVRDTLASPQSPRTLAHLLTATKPVKLCQAHGVVGCKRGCELIEIDLTTAGSETLLVIDSLSQLSDMALLIADKATASQNNAFAKYAEQGRMLTEILVQLQSANYHTLCITHATTHEDATDKKEHTIPLCGTKNFSLKVGKFFSHVIYQSLETRKFKAGSLPTYKLNTLTGTRDSLEMESKDSKATLASVFK